MSQPYPEQVVPGGVLVYPAIRSPNFIHGVQGWSINVDGSAEFHSVIIPTQPGLTVTFASTAPANPLVGDIWYDVSNGNLEHQWNGTSWLPFQVGTGAVAPGAITTDLIQDNAITQDLIADQAITETKIADDSVSTPKLQAGAVTAENIEAGIVVAGIVDSTVVEAATFLGSTFNGTDFTVNNDGAFFYSP